jgi:hypothetical protein
MSVDRDRENEQLTPFGVDRTSGTQQWVAGPLAWSGGNSQIQVNGSLNWLAPQATSARDVNTGQWVTLDFLNYYGQVVEADRPLTNAEFFSQIILHEVGHLLGEPQESSNTYDKRIFEKCIKGKL